MENNIKLGSNYHVNSYLKHFQVAQVNFNLVVQEEPRFRQKFRRRYLLRKSA